MKYEIVNLGTWKRGESFLFFYRKAQCHEYDGRYRCYRTHKHKLKSARKRAIATEPRGE